LLGLLFVGVSINLSAIAADERVDLRARAGQAFTNLMFVLLIGLVLLIPNPAARLLAVALGLLAAVALIRVVMTLGASAGRQLRTSCWHSPPGACGNRMAPPM
jgi:hypothetical protein